MFSPLKTAALAIAAFCLYGGSANADTIREVQCANGKTVLASGTQSNRQACLTIASQQTALLLPAVQKAREAAARLENLK